MMTNNPRRVVALILLLLPLFGLLPQQARALEDPNIQAAASILADPKTGLVLYEKNADEKRYPASTTKIMTALIVLERANLADMVTATEEDFATLEPGSSNAGLKVGETVSVHDLLYCLMLPSANEAANMLARHVAGSQTAFATLMNDKARQLGCQNTHFMNPNGLHNENHYTTARDLFTITSAALENETFAEIANTAQKTLQATNMHPERKIFTTNYLILRRTDPAFYSYCKGVKTGYTEAAGNCLVATATKKEATLVSVVLGCERPAGQIAHSFGETKRLFEWGFTNFKARTLVEKDEPLTETVKVRLSTETDEVVLKTRSELTAVVPIDLTDEALTRKLNLPEDVVAPIKAGDVLGTMEISYDGVVYGTVELVALSDVSLSSVLYYADKLENFFKSALFRNLALGVGGLILIYVLYVALIGRQRRRRKDKMMRSKTSRYRRYK